MTQNKQAYTAFNTDDFDVLEEPIFFGRQLSIARTDVAKHELFQGYTEKQLGFFWRPEEIDVTKDRSDFGKLPPNEQHIFTSNLKYQVLLDSVQGRAPSAIFEPICSNAEFEDWIAKWNFSETIHSNSYTHIIRGIYSKSKEQFDEIVRTPEILERACSVTADYDKLMQMIQLYQLGLNEQTVVAKCGVTYEPFCLRDMKKQLMRTMYQVQIVEAIRFYVSFACSFAFAERKVMEGNGKIIKLIARDEILHFNVTQKLIHIWKSGADDPEMAEIYAEMEQSGELHDMYWDAIVQEKDWAKYLFKDGGMIGLNYDILCQYIDYIASIRMQQVGIKPFMKTPEDPLPWMNNHIDSDSVQVAPQEVELTSYLTNATDNNIDEDAFADFDADFDFEEEEACMGAPSDY